MSRPFEWRTSKRMLPYTLRWSSLAAVLAFIPLTHSVFWGTLAYTLIGGTFGGTVLTLMFLPALYAIWFKIKPVAKGEGVAGRGQFGAKFGPRSVALGVTR